MPSDNATLNPRQPTRTTLTHRRRWLAAAAAGAMGLILRPGIVQAAVDPASVAEPKRTKAGRYLMAADVQAFIPAQGGAGKVLFLDLRTRAEAMYVGMAIGIDTLEPFVEHQELMTDTVVLICRSGDRSSRGANRLADDGYTQVWSVVDGFEGDMGKDGRRSINGWKNAGLPWSYKLDRDRIYFPR